MQFKRFLVEMAEFPNLMDWVRNFFKNRMSVQTLWIYADWLEENGFQQQAEFFHKLAQWQDPRRKKGVWHGNLVRPFYDLFGFPGPSDLTITKTGNSWFLHPRTPSPKSGWASSGWKRDYSQMSRHIVYPGETSYRLSLTNGQWSAYTNKKPERVSVVSTKHKPTPESEQWFPQGRVSLNNYKSVDVSKVPDDVLYYAFYHIIEKQVRGGH